MRTNGGLGMLWYAGRQFGDFSLQLQFRDGRTDGGWSNSGVFVRFPDPRDDGRAARPTSGPRACSGTRRPGVGGDLLRPRDPDLRRPGRRRAAEDRLGLQLRAAQHRAGARRSPKGEWNDYEIRVVGQHVHDHPQRRGASTSSTTRPASSRRAPATRRPTCGSSPRATSACRTTATPTRSTTATCSVQDLDRRRARPAPGRSRSTGDGIAHGRVPVDRLLGQRRGQEVGDVPDRRAAAGQPAAGGGNPPPGATFGAREAALDASRPLGRARPAAA